MKTYNNIKWIFYMLSMTISVGLIFLNGSNGSHTTLVSFVSAFLFFVVGGCWLILDWLLNMNYTDRSFNMKIHLVGLFLTFLVMIGSMIIEL